MSNIIKWNYINFDTVDKLVIDSDMSKKVKDNIVGEASSGFIAGIHITTPQELADAFLRKQIDNGDSIEDMQMVKDDKMIEEERKRIAVKANSLISDAKKKAEALVEEAMQKVDEIKTQAYDEGKQEGFEAGLSEGRAAILSKEQKIEEMEEELKNQKTTLEDEFCEKEKRLEPLFAGLITSIIEKITGVVIENKKEVILHLIQNGMADVGRSSQFLIHVSSEDIEFVKERKDVFYKVLPEEIELEIIEDRALTKNQCIIETDSRMVDSSLDIQLRNLLEDLRILSIS